MLKNKIIIVEGMPVSGKSTTANFIAAMDAVLYRFWRVHVRAIALRFRFIMRPRRFPKGNERNEFVLLFFDSFMKGYARANSSTSFVSQIDLFIDFRHLFSYTYHSVYLDQNQWTEQQRPFIENMRLSLVHDPSYLGFKLIG